MAHGLLQSLSAPSNDSAISRVTELLEVKSSYKDELFQVQVTTEEVDSDADQPTPAASWHESLQKTHLISSPYPDAANQLDLRDLDTPYRLFALALTVMRPIRDDYATGPYLESFNWPEIFSTLRAICREAGFVWQEHVFYVVVFRSQLTPLADRQRLGELDQRSHEEACASGGLLKYWFGAPNAERRNLATCLWRNRQDAVEGGKGPWHKQARAAARYLYDNIEFNVHQLTVSTDAKSWRLEALQR